MPGADGLGCPLERDELVSQVDEPHPAAAPSQLNAIDEPAEELEHLVDVPDLDGNMVDPDEAHHGTSVTSAESVTWG